MSLAPPPAATASDLLEFLARSPTPYHAVREAARRLEAAGYRALDEREPFALEAGARAYVVRGGGTIVALELGTRPPADGGFVILGAHTDSPNLRLKPVPDLVAHGHRQLAVEPYGGVLLHTWLDRDLSLAGRVTLADGTTRLIHVERPVARVSSLAIHLDRAVNTSGLVLNPQTHLPPTFSLVDGTAEGLGLEAFVAAALATGGETLTAKDVAAFDLMLLDAAPPARLGAGEALLASARLDDLAGSHAALSALLTAGPPAAATRVVALFDHEECGSQSLAGAKSRLLASVLERATMAVTPSHDAFARAAARSILVSVDMAHALHPNYADKHDRQHAPRLGGGPVLKVNTNMSYASDAPSEAAFLAACAAGGIPTQRFVTRSDVPCGSTIGPMSAALLGVRAVDVGNPMLSMHSCREVAAAADAPHLVQALAAMLRGDHVPAAEA
ncbi:MAG: M18 family aminopeptidase [Polyangiaceae bacterium]|nr:M18 family aminopeptidase [Polyangiaceae bacterium]